MGFEEVWYLLRGKRGGTPLKSEKIFLSPQQVDGFPKNIDYIKEWGFK